MNHTCDVCSCNTNGWVKTSYKASTYTYCSYNCYQKMPTILPTQRAPTRVADDAEPVVLPLYKPTKTNFNFLSETEVNQLTTHDYETYKEQLREQLDGNYDMYHMLLENELRENELREKDMEEEFNRSSSDSDTDDY